jgi:hypothetical protein
MNGYEAESEAAVLLKGLGIPEALLQKKAHLPSEWVN